MAIEHGHSAIAELLIEAGHEAVEHRHFFDPGVVPIHEDEEEEGTPANPCPPARLSQPSCLDGEGCGSLSWLVACWQGRG